MNKLSTLILSHNFLKGSIPDCIQSMTALVEFNLACTFISSKFFYPIPPFLSLSLPFYLHFILFCVQTDNQLESTIPAVFSELKSLESLLLSGNSLIGSIPPEIGTMSALKQLGIFLLSPLINYL